MAGRKLQVEIERVLKKVAEGVQLFEEIFEKINGTNNANQKEKFEQDLKKEIKKLQRLRDQIKTWIASSEIKDKRVLMDNRKLIETQMERFKALEREMKTKQYSKEGLQAKEKLDPAEVAKAEAASWIATMVEKLNTQIDPLEAEAESIGVPTKSKRGGKSENARLKEIEQKLEQHKFHIMKLELMLRMLENESLAAEEVDSVKDSVEYYVDSNQDPDFVDDEGIYDHLNLIEDEAIGVLDEHIHTDDEEQAASASAALAASASSSKASSRKASKDAAETEKAAATAKKAATVPSATKASSIKLPPPAPLPAAAPAATATAAAAAAASTVTASAATASTSAIKPAVPPPQKYATVASDKTAAAAATTATTAASAAVVVAPAATIAVPTPAKTLKPLAAVVKEQQLLLTPLSDQPTPQPTPTMPEVASKPPMPEISFSSIVQQSVVQQQQQQHQQHQHHLQLQPLPVTTATKEESVRPMQPFAAQQLPHHPAAASPGAASTMMVLPESDRDRQMLRNKYPSSFADLISSFHYAKTKTYGRGDEVLRNQHLLHILDYSLQQCPDLMDSERPPRYTAAKPTATPPYYPQTAMIPFESPALYEQLDIDTLFFIFYYMPGTKQQYLAAKELKRQSWRFHKKNLMWFQRHEEPKAITDDYEQGTYVYFDYEGAWCQRKKTDFVFEYQYLEDE